MSYICQICSKKTSVGASKHHKRGVAGARWKKRVTPTPRVFKPNLQRVTLNISGNVKEMRICTKCLKRIRKYKSIYDFKNITVI